jgi:hypothetical protein
MIVFERVLGAANDQAKRRIEDVAAFKWDEYISRAVIGNFSTGEGTNKDSSNEYTNRKYLKKLNSEDVQMHQEQEELKEVMPEDTKMQTKEENIREVLTKAVDYLKKARNMP